MFESGYYPAGAENDTRAPYNQEGQQQKDFTVLVSVTLEKSETITTDDYFSEIEDDGSEYISTTDTDWAAAYEKDCYTIPELLNELQALAKEQIERYRGLSRIERKYKNIIASAQGWKVVDTNFEH